MSGTIKLKGELKSLLTQRHISSQRDNAKRDLFNQDTSIRGNLRINKSPTLHSKLKI